VQLISLFVGFGMNLATVLMHVSFVSLTLPWLRTHAPSADGGGWSSGPVLSAAITALMMLQLVSAFAWAGLFYTIGLAPVFSDAVYLSLTTISALGGDDAGRSSEWRMLLPLASINGALLFGLSTAVMFRLVTLFHLAPAVEARTSNVPVVGIPSESV
jgi:hypothetical protein